MRKLTDKGFSRTRVIVLIVIVLILIAGGLGLYYQIPILANIGAVIGCVVIMALLTCLLALLFFIGLVFCIWVPMVFHTYIYRMLICGDRDAVKKLREEMNTPPIWRTCRR